MLIKMYDIILCHTILYCSILQDTILYYLRELRALPQGRWFICALGRGSDGDGLKPGSPAAFLTTVSGIGGPRARKRETVES